MHNSIIAALTAVDCVVTWSSNYIDYDNDDYGDPCVKVRKIDFSVNVPVGKIPALKIELQNKKIAVPADF